MRNLLVILAVGLLIAGCGEQEKEPSGDGPTDAQLVEQARFTTMDGDTVAVSDYEGKVVLIDFWETWCKPCLAIFPTMQNLLEEYPEDFVVLAVNPGFADSKEDARAFISSHDYDFVYLRDTNNLSEKLGIQSIPYKVFVDASGSYIKSSLGSYGPEKDYKELKEIIEKHKKAAAAEKGE